MLCKAQAPGYVGRVVTAKRESMVEFENILSEAQEGYRILSEEEWESILANSEKVRTEEASLDHKIEIRKVGGQLLARETSDKGEIILRVFASDFALNAFVKRRVDIYERMWDGCGCKVDYYD